MAETSRTTPPARTIAYCSWHRGYSDTCRLVQQEDAGTMGPAGLFACADCRNSFELLPVADPTL